MKSDIITFKGINNGVYLEINSSEFDLVLKELNNRMDDSSSFFRGAKFLGARSNTLSDREILEINLILKYKYDLDMPLDNILNIIKKSNLIKDYVYLDKNSISNDQYTVESRFVHKTLRSGQVVEHNGNIVVIGDVNPGALLRSTGSIIVLGSLKGVAHAGYGGNTDAIVAAYDLSPNQLRIGNLIARAPDDDNIQEKLPEIARVYEDEVIIEPYLPNK